MRKRKLKLKKRSGLSTKISRISNIPVETSPISKHLMRRRTKVFLEDVPGLYVRQPTTKKVPGIRPQKKERIPIEYKGFQPEQRVTSCDKKRERRRRAFFGYANGPHAGKGTGKRLSPHGDRFTVKC